jgi:glycosyltransferase involved in cell wall biosynthesis
VAVITPYYKESEDILKQCYESVISQTFPCDHFFIADGHPNPALANWSIKHLVLPSAHGDLGNVARGIGGLYAAHQNYDFIAYLDADNWYSTNHIESLISLYQSKKVDVCASLRKFYTNQGECMDDFSEASENDHRHVDTNSMLIHRHAFQHLDLWLKIPKSLAIVGDRVFYQGLLRADYRFAYSDLRTICYRTLYKVHYLSAGLPLPIDAKEITSDFRKYLHSIQGMQTCVDQLGFIPRV